jgi:alpha-glucosidase (family GH31 glycosyl hydrolase)
VRLKIKSHIWLALAILVGLGMGASGDGTPLAVNLQNDFMRVQVLPQSGGLSIHDKSGSKLLDMVAPLRFTTVHDQEDPFSKGKAEPWTETPLILGLWENNDRMEINLVEGPGKSARAQITLYFINDRSLRVECEILDRPEVNRLSIRFKSESRDLYYGMGERYDSVEHSGKRIYNWTEEQFIGSGKLSWLFKGEPLTRLNTYFPVPFYLNPVRRYGLLLDDTHFSEFDFGKTEPGVLEIINFNDRMDLMIFVGDNPLDIITNYTAYTGRVKVAPPWAFGVFNAAAQGQERVYEVARITRENNIPTSGIWSEDWAWHDYLMFIGSKKSQWELNRGRYPDYEDLVESLHGDGFKFFAYFHPYIGCKSEAADEAAERGFLATTSSGEPYRFSFLLNKVVQPDLTRPEASNWWRDRFFKRAAGYGVDGWMHDFAEYTPARSQYANGEDGWAVHNAYPVMWAKAGREFWEQERPDGDWVFWMRSGYTGSWQYAPVMWTGDQNMDWERYDGIPSVIPAVNSVGISGSPVAATDIAGYHCIPGISSPTDKELYFRWTELGAMLPVMRIHESSGCSGNWLFDSDHETLMLWKKYAELHVSLFPYFYTLVHEAAATGWPVVRHLMLHYPDDPGSLEEKYEFMVGDRMLVAPVIENKAREREVYFPPGVWISWWNASRYQGPGHKTVDAPLDVIPLFVKSGTMLPTFDSQIDTLVKEDRDDLNGWDDANSSIKLLFFGNGEDELTLWDGTRFSCDAGEKYCEVSGAPVQRAYSYEFR